MVLFTLFFLLHFFHSPSECPRPPQLVCILLLLLCSIISSSSSSSSSHGADSGKLSDKVPCDASFIGLPTAAPQPESYSLPQQQREQQRRRGGGSGDDPGVGIDPPFLEWGDKPVLQPSALTLTISNQCNTSSLTIFPPWSTNSHFYASEPRVGGGGGVWVQPGDEYRLRVVFLPRVAGAMQGVLVIQTSSGGFLVQLQGRGAPSPFKLPLLPRLRLVPGETRRESILLHNPYKEASMSVREARVWPTSSRNRTLLLTNPMNNRVGVTSRCCEADGDDDDDGESYQVGIAPGGPWEVAAGETSLHAVELELRGGSGSWSGLIYLLLYVVSGGGASIEQVVVPIDVKVAAAAEEWKSLVAVPEVIDFGLVSSRRGWRRQGVYLVNAGSEAVEIERVSHSRSGVGGKGLVAVRYRKGVVIQAGSQVQVALAWYRSAEESLCLDKKLDSFVFHTNTSSSPSSQQQLLHVPYRALVAYHNGECDDDDDDDDEELVNHGHSGLQLPLSLFEELERRLFPSTSMESVFLPSGEFEMLQRDGKPEVSLRAPEHRLFPGSGLVFSAVEVGSEGSVWLSLTNPGDTAIAVELLVGERAQASDCKPGERASPRDSTRVFSLGVDDDGTGLLGASETEVFGPLVFRPTQRCGWTGLLALKNNLTGVEWVPLQGTGSFAELSFVDESDGLPLESLQLSGGSGVEHSHVSTISTGVDENLSRLSERLKLVSCNRPMNGSLVAKNTGDAPLKVHSVKLVNGRCSWQGFELASCLENFWLAAGESAELRVSYRPDFGASPRMRVRQDVRLVTSIGTVNFPVLVVLPDHMLRLCATIPFYFKYKKVMMLVGFLALLFLLLFLPGKLSGASSKESSDITDAGSTISLPFFREEAFAPMVSEDSSSNLSKIRVNVREDSQCSKSPSGGELKQQQHSIAVSSSPVSSPRKSSKSQLDRTKRKKRKAQGPLCSVKDQDKSSCSSPSSSAPASPAITPVSSQRPVSPTPMPASRLDVETGPGTAPPGGGFTAAQQASGPDSKFDGEWVTVDRKSSLVDRSGGERKRGGLTQSASFPSRSNSSKAGVQQAQICPSDRAPGSKLSKNSSSSSLVNEQDSCSERSNSGRFSPGDVIVEQADCRPSSLVYDIWGDHFAEMSRQSMRVSNDGAESLFAYSVLKQANSLPEQQEYYYQEQESSNFSMFSGNGAAAFMREVDEEELQQQQQQQQTLAPAHFLVSPFDLSYRFPHTPSV